MSSERLDDQIKFLLEADKMKSIYRQTYIIADESPAASRHDFKGENIPMKRRENDAEHSFHLALFAMVLAEHSSEKVDVLKVMKMVLIHDIVEIDAGDTYCYDKEGNVTKRQREERAADRIFGLLPEDQCSEYRGLWEEFERCDTPESRFANALDRMQPMLLNYTKGGISWREHGVKYGQVYERNRHIGNGSAELWEYMKNILNNALDKGYLKKDEE